MSHISTDDVRRLAGLARIELAEDEVENLRSDLGKILGYFEELKELDTSTVSPAIGGALEDNVYRADDAKDNFIREKSTDAFPETRDKFLKIPPVFE